MTGQQKLRIECCKRPNSGSRGRPVGREITQRTVEFSLLLCDKRTPLPGVWSRQRRLQAMSDQPHARAKRVPAHGLAYAATSSPVNTGRRHPAATPGGASSHPSAILGRGDISAFQRGVSGWIRRRISAGAVEVGHFKFMRVDGHILLCEESERRAPKWVHALG